MSSQKNLMGSGMPAAQALMLGYVTNAGSPVSSVTPKFIGQRLFDTSNSVHYIATGTTNTDWAVNGNPALSATELAYLDGVTAGTVTAGKAVVTTTGKVVDELDITTPKIGGTAITATAAEINRVADTSARVVDLAVSTAITEALHDGKTIVMGGAGSARTFTLPVPVAGMRFKFVVGAVNTSNYLIKSVAGTHLMKGSLLMVCDGGDTVEAFEAGSTDDTITLNGTTTGGASIGDYIEVEALSATVWAVNGVLTGTGDEVTPFSDTVT